jgi:signal transduction histidine kinase
MTAAVTAMTAALAAVVIAQAWQRRCLALVARASHELRGPLFAARLGLHGLEGSARVAAIDLELRRAALALEDLAVAPRGRRAPERAAAVELGHLLREAGEGWRALAADRGVALHVEAPLDPVVVHADRLRLVQACGNLVANAIEHGGGAVHVRTRTAASSTGARARIEVTDAGPGLPAPVPVLVAAARGRRARRGHGLALAAGIAERHGGRLTTAPSPRGARLVLELPCAAPAGRRFRRRTR